MIERIPLDELEISADWKVRDLATVDDCDEARLVLTRGIASIEAQLEAFDRETESGAEVSDADAEWRRKAQSAKKVKCALQQIVQNRRGDISRREKQIAAASRDGHILSLIRVKFPDAFAAAVAEYRTSAGAEVPE